MHCRLLMCGLVCELNDDPAAAVTLGLSALRVTRWTPSVCSSRAHGAGGPCSGSHARPQQRSAGSPTRREGRPCAQQRGSRCAASCARRDVPSGPRAAPSCGPQPAASGAWGRNSLQWACGLLAGLGSCVIPGAGPRGPRGLSRCAAARGARAVADPEHRRGRGGSRAQATPGTWCAGWPASGPPGELSSAQVLVAPLLSCWGALHAGMAQ